MKRFVVSGAALGDLDEIRRFVAVSTGPEAARKVLKEIRAVMTLIGNHPGTGHFRHDLTNRRFKFRAVYSWLIVYDPETKPVRIVRVLHGMRNVEEILN